MMRSFKYLPLVLVIVFLMACKEASIVHDLSERDANEIMVLLAKNDINSSKHQEIRNQESFWIVNVAKEDEIRAQSILVANNLPKIRQGGLKGICQDTSMIVTDETEQCRRLLAYKGEIINSLESIPGVVSADVVLNVPEKVEFPDENTPIDRPTAAVTIMYLVDANVRTDLNEGKVQEFVANSITGLDSRDVSVIISYLKQKIDKDPKKQGDKGAEQSGGGEAGDSQQTAQADELKDQKMISVGGIMMDEKSAQKFKIISTVFLVLLLLLSAAFIYALLKMSKLRKQSSAAIELDSEEKEDKKLLEA